MATEVKILKAINLNVEQITNAIQKQTVKQSAQRGEKKFVCSALKMSLSDSMFESLFILNNK